MDSEKHIDPLLPDNNKSKLLSSLASEDEENAKQLQHWKDVANALSIDWGWIQRQMGVIGLIALGVLLYITNRYQAQQEAIEAEALRNELKDWKYRSLTRSSELTLKCRQSNLEEILHEMGDTTITFNVTPPYKLTSKEKREAE